MQYLSLIVIPICLCLVLYSMIRRIKYQYVLKYYTLKNRARVLRNFKSIYYSYVFYENSVNDLDKNKIYLLMRNRFLGNDISITQKELEYKSNQLEKLSDDFKILYNDEEKVMPIQDFIFWYRLSLESLSFYTKEFSDYSKIPTKALKLLNQNLEQLKTSYEKINTLSLLSYLLQSCKIENISIKKSRAFFK